MQLTLSHLKKRYAAKEEGFVQAVDDVSLVIPDNTIFGIIGKSGAGKSSLVRLVSLLEAPDEGEVLYDGERVDNLSEKELIFRRRKIGMIFQNFNLLSSRTAAKNIAYPLEINGWMKDRIESRVKEMLSLVGLEGKGSAPISTLSGGQKQRVAIARALATNPDILFCDEATSALDPQTTHSILDLIRSLQKKMHLTVVMITHQMEVVRDACEQVAVIDSGKVVEQGTVEQIFSAPKTAVTKEFLSHISAQEPTTLLRWADAGKYTLRFIGKDTGEPVLSRLAKQFDIEFNIRAGGVQNVNGSDVGTLITDITGDAAEVQKAIEYLRKTGILLQFGFQHNQITISYAKEPGVVNT